jgi:EAL domain-containing protein (putative c-di-GMP-specific phosphodiesterase class I)
MSEQSALDTILQPGGLRPVFQPIFRVDGDATSLYGVECLSRGPRGTNFESAKVLFDYVRLKREESLVDRACISAALEEWSRTGAEVQVAINVHASTLGRDHGFVPFLRGTCDRFAVPLTRVTVEIVEHAPPWDGVSFLAALDQLRAAGACIALDDIGLGQSNFKMLLDVRPDTLKLDRYFVDGCARDPNRRAVIEAVAQLATRFGAEVVAEGVATSEDLAALRALGITLMQGFLFAAPMSAEEWRAGWRQEAV